MQPSNATTSHPCFDIMPTITLIKLSAPGWEKSFTHWADVRKELQGWICADCKASSHYRYHHVLHEKVAAGTSREEAIEIAREEASLCLPDNFMSLDDETKVECLLDTVCGAEFMVEVASNPEENK